MPRHAPGRLDQAAAPATQQQPGHPAARALTTGFARAFLAAAALLTLAINTTTIRTRRTDLAGAPQPVPAAPADPAQPR